jgi:rSAM/selenodomain-associated transferase 2
MISVIIPTYNEASVISKTIACLAKADNITEVIICDGGSTDDTVKIARSACVKVIESQKGRPQQMNAGAALAQGSLLYFLHADTLPPLGFSDCILKAVQNGNSVGCFTLKFNMKHWFLQANAWFTRFDMNAFRFGDQSLFVTTEVFKKAGGFNEKLIMLEDQEIIPRLKKYGRFIVINNPVATSARKYVTNGVYKTQAVYFIVYVLYRLGVSQQALLKLYRRWIVQDKL